MTLNNNNNLFLDNDNDEEEEGGSPYEIKRCSLCGRERYVEMVEIFYNAGKCKKMIYLCHKSLNNTFNNNVSSSPLLHLNGSCYFFYFRDLGYKLTVATWYQEAYETIRSIIISSPLLRYRPQSSSSSSSYLSLDPFLGFSAQSSKVNTSSTLHIYNRKF